MQEEPELHRAAVGEHRRFKAELARLGFDTGRSETPITPVMMGDPETAGALQRPADRRGRLRPAGGLPDRRHRPVADPHDRDGRPRRRAARPRARGVRRSATNWGSSRDEPAPGGPRGARPTGPRPPARCPPPHGPVARQRRPDRRLRPPSGRTGIGEIAITDHVDFEPGRPASRTRRSPSANGSCARPRSGGAPQGVTIRFGIEMTCDRRGRTTSATICPARTTTSRSAPSTTASVRSTPRGTSPAGSAGRSLADIVAPSFDEVAAGARTGLFDTIGHIDVVKRYLCRTSVGRARGRAGAVRADLRALIESGTALEVNTSGLRHGPAETYPSAAIVARFREARRQRRDHRLGRPSGEALRVGARRRLRGRALGRVRAPRRPRRRPPAVPARRLRAVDLTVRRRRALVHGPPRGDRRVLPPDARRAGPPARPGAGLVHPARRGCWTRRTSMRSSSATCTRTTSSTWSAPALPALGAAPRTPGPGRSARPASRIGSTRCMRSPGSARPRSMWRSWPRGPFAVGGPDGFLVEARHVTHEQPSFGFRVTRADGMRDRARVLGRLRARRRPRAADPSGDALLSEVSFGPGPVPPDAQHLDGPAVGSLAARTGSGRVLLTHLQMGFDREATVASVRARYDGPVDLVDPGRGFRSAANRTDRARRPGPSSFTGAASAGGRRSRGQSRRPLRGSAPG